MITQKCVTTTIENANEKVLSVSKCTEPIQKASNIYRMMKYKDVPFYRKKSVVVPAEIFKNDTS